MSILVAETQQQALDRRRTIGGHATWIKHHGLSGDDFQDNWRKRRLTREVSPLMLLSAGSRHISTCRGVGHEKRPNLAFFMGSIALLFGISSLLGGRISWRECWAHVVSTSLCASTPLASIQYLPKVFVETTRQQHLLWFCFSEVRRAPRRHMF